MPEEAPELTAASPKRIGRRKTSASRILPGPGRFPTRDARGWISPTQLDAPEGVEARSVPLDPVVFGERWDVDGTERRMARVR